MTFFVCLLLFGGVEFWAVHWAVSATKGNAVYAAVSASGMMALTIAAMWLALVGESLEAASGMVVGAGLGAFLGCKVFANADLAGREDTSVRAEDLL